jgi:hypothetical protein
MEAGLSFNEKLFMRCFVQRCSFRRRHEKVRKVVRGFINHLELNVCRRFYTLFHGWDFPFNRLAVRCDLDKHVSGVCFHSFIDLPPPSVFITFPDDISLSASACFHRRESAYTLSIRGRN